MFNNTRFRDRLDLRAVCELPDKEQQQLGRYAEVVLAKRVTQSHRRLVMTVTTKIELGVDDETG